MATYTITATPSGSNKDNDAQRDIAAVFPYDANQYRTISEIVRRDGIWCSCGGSSQSVTMEGYDQLIDSATGTVIKTSDNVQPSALLGDSEVFAVKHHPFDMIPHFNK